MLREQISDGTRLVLRPIQPDDKPRLAVGVQRLSPESQRKRFLAAKPRLTSSELKYLTEVDGERHIAWVAVLEDDPDTIVGVARVVRFPDEPDLAELAIVIGDPWQGHGLGRRLTRLLADEALRRGVRRIAATTLGDNDAALALVRGIARSYESDSAHDGVRELVVALQ